MYIRFYLIIIIFVDKYREFSSKKVQTNITDGKKRSEIVLVSVSSKPRIIPKTVEALFHEPLLIK